MPQAAATCICAFGFGGYAPPRYSFSGCSFCQLSSGGNVPFFPGGVVPIARTEGEFQAAVVGCVGYIFVAWIWSAIWYFPLDLIKWCLCWVLNEDGFRDEHAIGKRRAVPPADDKGAPTVSGAVGGSHANPLGRASLSKVPANVLDKVRGRTGCVVDLAHAYCLLLLSRRLPLWSLWARTARSPPTRARTSPSHASR